MSGLGHDCRVVGMRYRSECARKRIRKAVQGNRQGNSVRRSSEQCKPVSGLLNRFWFFGYRIPDGWLDGAEIKISKSFIPTNWLKSKTGGKSAADFSVSRAA